jgi:predicted GTPase
LIDPRPYVVGQIKAAFERYPGIGPLLPALGYGPEQIADLERTVDAVPADAVVIATPIDLRRLIRFNRPTVRVSYDLAPIGQPDLSGPIGALLRNGKRRS